MKVRIEAGRTGVESKVWLDDVDISAQVVSVTLSVDVHDVTKVSIELKDAP